MSSMDPSVPAPEAAVEAKQDDNPNARANQMVEHVRRFRFEAAKEQAKVGS